MTSGDIKENIIKNDKVHKFSDSNNISIKKSVKLINNKYETNVELLDFVSGKINNSNIQDNNCNLNNSKNKIVNYNNYYKNNIINKEGLYKTLIKEFPLLDFCINKIKNIKNKKYSNYYNLV